MIKYEFRKIWKSKKTLFFLLIIIIVNGILYWLDINNDTLYKGGYKQYFNEVQTQNKPLEWLNEEDKINFYINFSMLSYDIDSTYATPLQEWEDKYNKQWVKLRSDEANTFLNTNSNTFDYQLTTLKQIRKEITNAQNYDTWKKALVDQAKSSDGLSVFQKNKVQQEINKKTYQRYEKLKTNHITAEPTIGIQKLLSYTPIDIFVLLLIVYLIIHLILKEKESSYFLYTLSTKNGKKKQFFTKLVALTSVVAISTILIFLECYIISLLAYGNIDIFAPVQSLSIASTFPFDCTILIYLFIYIIIAISVFCIFALIISSIGYVSRSFILIIATVSTIYGISFFLYNEITTISSFSILHTLNLYSLLHPLHILNNFAFFNFGNVIVSHLYTIAVTPILWCLLAFIGYQTYQKLPLVGKHKKWQLPKIFKAKPSDINRQEFNKLMIKEKAILISICLVCLCGYLVIQQSSITSSYHLRYNQFISSIGNHVNSENTIKLNKQINYYQDLNDKLKNAQTTDEQSKYISLLSNEEIFTNYQYAYEQRINSDPQRDLLKEDEYLMYFQDNTITKSCFILLIATMLLLIVQNHHREKQSGMITLQNCSPNKNNVIKWKTIHMLMVMGVLTFIIFMIQILKIKMIYPHASLMAHVNAMSQYFYSGISVPIWMYLVLVCIAQLTLISSLVLLFSYIMRKWNQRNFVLLMGVLIIIIPVLLTANFHKLGIHLIYLLFYPHTVLTNQYLGYVIFIIVLILINIFSLIKIIKK